MLYISSIYVLQFGVDLKGVIYRQPTCVEKSYISNLSSLNQPKDVLRNILHTM